jgi:fructose-bisphosphate aldolase class 1
MKLEVVAMDKRIFEVYLYDDGTFEVKESDRDYTNNNFHWGFNNKSPFISMDCCLVEIDKTKQKLINHKIKGIKNKLKEVQAELKIFEGVVINEVN